MERGHSKDNLPAAARRTHSIWSIILTTHLPDGSIQFRFFRPRVASVVLAGSFNGWSTDAMPMESEADGWWQLTLQLPPGEYQFRYLADGAWFTDHAANGIERVRGAWNSMLFVSGEPMRAAA